MTTSLSMGLPWTGEMTGTAPLAPVVDASGLPDELDTAAEFVRLLGLMAQDDFSLVREPAEAILASDDRTARDDALSAALTALAFVAWDQGRVRDARGLLRASIQRADRGTVAPLRVYSRLALASILTAAGELDEADTMIREGREELESSGATTWADAPAALRARLQLVAGRPEEAVADAEAALATAERVGTHLFVPLAMSTLASTALSRGDLDEAERQIERDYAAPASRSGFGSGSRSWIEARLAEAGGGARAAALAASSIYDDLVGHKRLLIEEPAAAAWLVRVALVAGDHHGAQMVVAAAEQLAADNEGVASVEVAAMHARGLFDREPGALTRAASDHRHLWARASASEDLTTVLAEENASVSRAEGERARAAYEQAGADRDAGRVCKKLRLASAERRNGRPVQGWRSLTPTERRVAGNVADGMTNREVAARMERSSHTVDIHLRHIFRKLHINSRVELTRIVLERG